MQRALIMCLVSSIAAGCGGSDGGGGGGGDSDGGGGVDGGGGGTGRYFPLEVGASWTFRVVDVTDGSVSSKTQSVDAFEDVGGDKAGVMAFRLRSDKDSGYSISWQEDTGTAIVRHREESYDAADVFESEDWFAPGKLRIDESPDRVELDATFTNSYDEMTIDHTNGDLVTTTTKTEDWLVEAVDDVVDVPAGSFSCLRLYRSNDGTGTQKRYWFARGVGKVKETGGAQVEELADYTIP